MGHIEAYSQLVTRYFIPIKEFLCCGTCQQVQPVRVPSRGVRYTEPVRTVPSRDLFLPLADSLLDCSPLVLTSWIV